MVRPEHPSRRRGVPRVRGGGGHGPSNPRVLRVPGPLVSSPTTKPVHPVVDGTRRVRVTPGPPSTVTSTTVSPRTSGTVSYGRPRVRSRAIPGPVGVRGDPRHTSVTDDTGEGRRGGDTHRRTVDRLVHWRRDVPTGPPRAVDRDRDPDRTPVTRPATGRLTSFAEKTGLLDEPTHPI